MPKGFNNRCEHWKTEDTLPEVLHAELNSIAKLAASNQSSKGSTLYSTLEPCFECSKLIIQAKITRVVYRDSYRFHEGLELLKQANIKVEKIYG